VATYRYIAQAVGGGKQRGVLTAPSEHAALAELDRRSLVPISISEYTGRAERTGGVRVPAAQLAVAYTQVGDLLKAGVPLLRALRLLSHRKKTPKLAQVFEQIAGEVEDGKELAAAMADRPESFRRIHVAMIRAGEKGGFLERSLHRLGTFVQHQVELRRKVVGASIYPAVIATVGVLILLGLFIFFIPLFREQFSDIELPALTKLLFASSDAIRNGWWLGPIVFVLAGAGWAFVSRNDAARRIAGEVVLRTPQVGRLLRDLAVARFCRVLGTLLESGVPMLDALRIAKDAAGFDRMASAIDDAASAVRGGEPLADPLSRSGLFPDDVVEMITVAEQANNLDHVLVGIADTLDARVDRLLTTTVRLIEPILLLTIAVCVVIVALGLILAMMRLTSSVDL
jgi:general secretion pathway protein F/type IV pilus assembly protein PilC